MPLFMDSDWRRRLRDAIDKDGRKPRAISLAAGLGPNYLGQLLNKDKEPGLEKFIRLCDELHVSAISILLGGDLSAEDEEVMRLLTRLDSGSQALVRDLARRLAGRE
jgi:hypothetical protein